MSEIKDGGSAFPFQAQIRYKEGVNDDVVFGGMTLRDWFAGMALQGRFANPFIQENQMKSFDDAIKAGIDDALLGVRWDAEWAYRIADAMIAEREKSK